jgi:predicted nucleic acid-binding protein
VTQYLVDASVAAKWFIPEAYAAEAERLINDDDDLCAPELILHEVASVMLKRLRRKEMSEARARGAIEQLPLLVRPVSSASAARLAMDIAIRYELSSYDAVYMALAIEQGCALVTADRRLYNALASPELARSLLWIEDVPLNAG